MGIKKGDYISKDSIFEYMATKDYEKRFTNSVAGAFFTQNTKEHEEYFWIRNDMTKYQSTAWDIGTTYALDSRIHVGDEVWYSVQNGNVGHDPQVDDGTWWRAVDNPTVTTSILDNIKLYTSFHGIPEIFKDYVEFQIWKVTWPTGTEVLTLLYDVTHQQSIGVNSFTDYYSVSPGYYKIRSFVSSKGSNSSSATTLYTKPYANDMMIDKTIRVFNSDYKDLANYGDNEVTTELAKTGRMSSDDYFGGDFGG